MAPAGTVQVISKETIKPSSPTPSHLSTFTLSLLDLVIPPMYVSIMLFFDSKSNSETELDSDHRRSLLKRSLSETLTHFYTLAGRIKDNFTVDCKDQGVDYFEAKVDTDISKFMNSDVHIVNQLLPHDDILSPDMSMEVPLVIQVNMFDCGGIVISVSMSHSIADASSITSFINTWAAISRGSTKLLTPTFDTQFLFPPQPLSITVSDTLAENVSDTTTSKFVTKRYIFNGGKLATLRAKIAAESPDLKYVTRVEAVSALIWKSIMKKSGPLSKQTSALLQAVNLRKRMNPPLPKQSFGNAVLMTKTMVSNDYPSLGELVGHMQESISKFNGDYIRKQQGDNEEFTKLIGGLLSLVAQAGANVYLMTSWCRFPLYDSDFGWGKPDWVTCYMAEAIEVEGFLLMDTKDGEGIEAGFKLKEETMASLELNEEFLAFVS